MRERPLASNPQTLVDHCQINAFLDLMNDHHERPSARAFYLHQSALAALVGVPMSYSHLAHSPPRLVGIALPMLAIAILIATLGMLRPRNREGERPSLNVSEWTNASFLVLIAGLTLLNATHALGQWR